MEIKYGDLYIDGEQADKNNPEIQKIYNKLDGIKKCNKAIYFKNIAQDLEKEIEGGVVVIRKGFIKTEIKKDLKVYVMSGDHLPIHFHVKSKNKKYHQKFDLKTFENISKNKDHRFDLYIKKFFRKNKMQIKIIESKFKELNSELNY